MMALFVWGRIRYDLVALLALAAGLATGIVPADKAFGGFSDDIVVIVASALVTSAAIAKSGVADLLISAVGGRLKRPGGQIAALAGTVMVLSALVKNIGALSMLIPPAIQITRRTGTSLSLILMPMSFASLLGGIVTLVGTSPNIIVSKLRADITGQPFGMFDFTPVGLPIAVLGLAFLIVGYRLLPRDRRGPAGMDAAFNFKGYATEAIVPEGWPLAGRSAEEVAAAGGPDVLIAALIRDEHKRFRSPKTQLVRPGDRLILEGEPTDLERFVAAAGLKLARAEKKPDPAVEPDDIGVMEAVVTGNSMLVNWSPAQVRLSERFGLEILAVGRSDETVATRLRALKLRAGDVLVLKGNLKIMPEVLGELGCLPLASRDVKIGDNRRSLLPILILAGFMGLMAAKILPVPVAFFGAALSMAAIRAITMREAYDALDGPVLVTLAALIPVSEAMRTTGATEVIAGWLSAAAGLLPPAGTLALVMVVAMAITPFLNNAATVLVAAPIAAGLAQRLGQSPDPYLMAIALGAACDFLTPIGHQCNMLVMGPGGYRFGDYWRLGLPLSVLVVVAGVPLILWVWPF
ncbi:SLC13 family permease [Prosthecomicrobium sp. N25]